MGKLHNDYFKNILDYVFGMRPQLVSDGIELHCSIAIPAVMKESAGMY